MTLKTKIPHPIVKAEWLYSNLHNSDIIVLNATIAKVGDTTNTTQNKQIPNSIFFDLKNIFVDTNATFPNTIPKADLFEKEVQLLGIHTDSCIVVYDALGTYSSPRVWWLFHVFGFTNIAVLNGGLPAWKKLGYPTIANNNTFKKPKGNFKVSFVSSLLQYKENVLEAIHQDICIIDARSQKRFDNTEPEPRKDLRGGHIPSSKNIPYTLLQQEGFMKTKEAIETLFQNTNTKASPMIFTCGSGITACILALGAAIIGNTNYSVYDGSWTEWASILELPIEK
jgi:thiosulfate/3-mercaptopyruvate sulfurtransferase